ncbi:ABC transporter ATP-binding protein [Ferrimonas sediminicola]|uniref:ABC transporter ATP-binding protein n=1 Tax=Ferrimonas sediminicola TaxID=2569538 RepID=UPI001E48629B|nr:ABC transporter ATP-binding protein [Ferrimonas sediminicola]
MSNELVKLTNITKVFPTPSGQVEILKGINLTLRSGEFATIEGPSGSGKSTLLSILGLLDHPSRGEYLLSGTPVTGLSEYQLSVLRSRELGWVFQNFNLIGDLNVWQNLALALKYAGQLPKRRYDARIRDVLTQVGLEEKVLSLPAQLSGGQQQRLAIARALINDPSLVLADEPTGNLDHKTSRQIVTLLQDLHRQGTTVVMITHDPELAALGQSRYRMDDGCLIQQSAEPRSLYG